MTETRGEYQARMEARRKLLLQMIKLAQARLYALAMEHARLFTALTALRGGITADLSNDATWAELLTMAAQEMMEAGDDGQSRPES